MPYIGNRPARDPILRQSGPSDSAGRRCWGSRAAPIPCGRNSSPETCMSEISDSIEISEIRPGVRPIDSVLRLNLIFSRHQVIFCHLFSSDIYNIWCWNVYLAVKPSFAKNLSAFTITAPTKKRPLHHHLWSSYKRPTSSSPRTSIHQLSPPVSWPRGK